MARIHGRGGTLYVDPTGSAAASPLAFLTKWTLPRAVDLVEVTACGDGNKTYVSGLPDSKGSVAGWYDDSSAQLYTAASDGIARKFYLYPDGTNSAKYWFGSAFFDETVTGGVSEAVSFSGNFGAASNIIKV